MVSISIPSTAGAAGGPATETLPRTPATPLLADYIDPDTNDYVSLAIGFDPVDAQVINALKIVRRSGASVFEIGTRLKDIRKITDSIRNEIESQIRFALAPLVKNRDIIIESIIFDIVDPGNQTVQVRPVWRNLRSIPDKSTSLVIVLES